MPDIGSAKVIFSEYFLLFIWSSMCFCIYYDTDCGNGNGTISQKDAGLYQTMTTVREDPDFSSGASLIPPEKPFRWRRRILSRWGVVYTVAGNGEIALGEARCTVGPGDLLLCAPEMEHCYTGFPGWRYLWFHLLPPDGIELPDGPEPVPGVVTLHFSEWAGAAARSARSA